MPALHPHEPDTACITPVRGLRRLALLAMTVAGTTVAAATGPAGPAAPPGPGQGPDETLQALEPAPAPVDIGLAGERPADIARYVLAAGVQQASISPDGRWIAALAAITGVPQLWIVPAVGGAPRQLTFGNGVTDWRWAPDGASLVYAADGNGDGQEGFVRISVDGLREVRLLDAAPGVFRALGPVLPGGREFVHASTAPEGLDYDVWVRDLASGAERKVFAGRFAWQAHAASPDGRWLLISERVGEDSDHVDLLDLAAPPGTPPRVLARPERRANSTGGGFAWLPDSTGFYFASNAGREFAALQRYDVASGRTTLVAEATHDIENVVLCGADASHLLWTTNEDGFDRLHARDLRSGHMLPPSALPALPEGQLQVDCPTGSPVAAIRIDGWATPGDLVAWEPGSGQARTVWASNLAGLDRARLVRPQSIRMPARDGVMLQGLLYLPHGGADPPPPVVFDVHGGPTGQSRARFSARAQYLANRGIAVFEPNVRGSTGFGHTYATLDDRERRLDSIRDLVDMLAHLRTDPRVDARRAAVVGASYGGYAVNAVLAQYPGEFLAGVAMYGVADWVTALQVASPSLKASDRIEYGDIDDPQWLAFYQRISPIRQADRIRVPVLYAHGVNDRQVDIHETETMVRTLRAAGVTAPYIRMRDEGHGWRKLANQLFYFRHEAAFLARHLVPGGIEPGVN
jgi:dipeptidyl aminopeptidase/acylaminoacyl peptidase